MIRTSLFLFGAISVASMSACAATSTTDAVNVNKAQTTLEPKTAAKDENSGAVPLSASGTTPVLTTEGYGPVLYGMTLAELEQTLGFKAVDESLSPDPACHYIRIETLPDARFMVQNNVITRAETGQGIPTMTGATVGSHITDPATLQGTPNITPVPNDAHARYYTFGDTKNHSAIIMVVRDGVVTSIRGGFVPAVNSDKGCE